MSMLVGNYGVTGGRILFRWFRHRTKDSIEVTTEGALRHVNLCKLVHLHLKLPVLDDGQPEHLLCIGKPIVNGLRVLDADGIRSSVSKRQRERVLAHDSNAGVQGPKRD
jgi:hypothetical protein